MLVDRVEDLQEQLEGMKLKVEAQPIELQQQLERVVLEGNNVEMCYIRISLSALPSSRKSVIGWV
jgi:hypothetical protein